MKLLLDTDTCIHALKRNPGVLERLLSRSQFGQVPGLRLENWVGALPAR